MVEGDKEEEFKEGVAALEPEKEWVLEMQVVGQVEQGIHQEGDVQIILLVNRIPKESVKSTSEDSRIERQDYSYN